MIEDIFRKLQQELELTGKIGGSGTFAIALDDTTVTIAESPHGIEFAATLGNHPTEYPELFFAKMLRGNLFGQATMGAILGLDESGERLVLHSLIPDIKAPYVQVKEKLEDFLNAVDFWKNEIVLHQKSPTA